MKEPKGYKMQECLSGTEIPKNNYSTSELKLAALLLAEVPDSSFEVSNQSDSAKKLILVSYPKNLEIEVQRLISEYIERRARVDLYRFNKVLNPLRDSLYRGQGAL